MAYCYEVKAGEVYACRLCGFEIQILKAGEDLGLLDDDKDCGVDDKGFSRLKCCGVPMNKKNA